MWRVVQSFIFLSILAFKAKASDTTFKILFIGNSLTYTNNLPALVKEIASQDSVNVQFTSISLPNYSLEDHLNEGLVQKEIEKGNYHFVVAQQGPSAMPESQVQLLAHTKKLSEVCKQYNTKLCLFTVWPSKERAFDHDGVIASYSKAASQTNSMIAPAGLAWKIAWQNDAALPLYGVDGFHPSFHGSFLSAITIYTALKKKKTIAFLTNNKMPWSGIISDKELKIFKASVLIALNSPD